MYVERFITAAPAVMDQIRVFLVCLIFAAMLCTLPLILYTVRVTQAPVPGWKKAVVVAGLVAGVLSNGLVVLAYVDGMGLAMGAH